METAMAKHHFSYPDRLHNCQFCNGKDIEMEAAVFRLPDKSLTCLFNMKCLTCEYATAQFEYPDAAINAWNLAKKIEIMRLIDNVNQEYKKQQ